MAIPLFSTVGNPPLFPRQSLTVNIPVSFRRVYTEIRSGFEVDLSRNVANRRAFTTFSLNSMASRILVAFSQ